MRRRGGDDGGLELGTSAVAVLVVALVAAIGLELLHGSRLSIAKFGWSFWTGRDWDPVSGEFGALPFIWGTFYSSLLALLVAAPVGVGIAVFTTDVVPPRFRRPLAFLSELLAAVPSIVYGLWGIFVLVPIVRGLETFVSRTPLRKLPLFSGPPYGLGMLSAGLILALMVIPYVTSVSREVLQAVPVAQREAAYALGATRWEAIRAALHYGRTGILGAVFLGFGRAFGETMAVTMVIGNNPQLSASLFAPQYSMAAVIANEFSEATGDLYLHALTEIGLVLFVVTLLVNAGSRLLIWTVQRGPGRVSDAVPAPEAMPPARAGEAA